MRRAHRVWAAALAVVVLVAGMGQAATAAPPEGDIRDAGGPTAIEGQYIVVLKDTTAGANEVDGAARALAARYEAGVDRIYTRALRGFSMTATERQARRLAADPAVDFVSQDQEVQANGNTVTPSWGLDRIDERSRTFNSRYEYHESTNPVTVYVIDSGIRISHSQFFTNGVSRAVYGRDTVNNDANAEDCNGHGTHVAGTIGGNTYGVNPSARLVAVRVYRCDGTGSVSQVIDGVNWVLEDSLVRPEPTLANASLGNAASSAMDHAVRNAIRLGVTFTVSAGNNNTNACNQSPARVAEAITVGASNTSDARAWFSNHGSCVDIFAPGEGITSAWHTSSTAAVALTGTSMAAPHVAGAASLYLQRWPSASPAQVHAAIVNNGTAGVLSDVGAGSPNMLLYSIYTPTPRSTPADYDGDRASEIAVWRPSTGDWHIRGFGVVQWGGHGDVPVPGDYTGDGRAEIAVWRPSTGDWHIRGVGVVQWGHKTDLPVPADYNGDGRVDIAVWRPPTGEWHIRSVGVVKWGLPTDIPVPMYRIPAPVVLWRAAIAVWRPSTGQWHTWFTHGATSSVTWGLPTDIPVPGRYHSTSQRPIDIAVYRPTHFQWHIESKGSFQWPSGPDGGINDIPVPANFLDDGDSHEFAVWRPTTGEWRIEGLSSPIQWGHIADIPITA
ncbi:S8 family serine peptidase [Phytohabitans sp. LJ34]|uniref:S8 family serine peptidase n=1 Tax=Phytohabitans sp. LJ34 TaxID=3452217 RepID=UPI003F89CE9B